MEKGTEKILSRQTWEAGKSLPSFRWIKTEDKQQRRINEHFQSLPFSQILFMVCDFLFLFYVSWKPPSTLEATYYIDYWGKSEGCKQSALMFKLSIKSTFVISETGTGFIAHDFSRSSLTCAWSKYETSYIDISSDMAIIFMWSFHDKTQTLRR